MRILLAEDEKALSKALVKLLEKNNYSVDAVYDGMEALNYLESGLDTDINIRSSSISRIIYSKKEKIEI